MINDRLIRCGGGIDGTQSRTMDSVSIVPPLQRNYRLTKSCQRLCRGMSKI